MAPLLSDRARPLRAFLAPLVVGLRAGRTDDGAGKVRTSVPSNVAGTLGPVLGFAFATRSKRYDR